LNGSKIHFENFAADVADDICRSLEIAKTSFTSDSTSNFRVSTERAIYFKQIQIHLDRLVAVEEVTERLRKSVKV
jgi:methionine synthase II (cobalamin-independent)